MDSFKNARFTLTFWYCLILFIILLIFSVALFSIENSNFTRIVIQRDFGSSVPKTVTTVERGIILQQVRELRRSFVTSIFFIDLIILVLGGGLGFFLAGKTLAPIQKSLKQQTEFLADASHELRTPLAAIQTACEVTLRGKNKTENDYRTVITRVHDESVRLGIIANELFELSRFDAKVHIYQPTIIWLDEIVREVIPEIQPLMTKKNIYFTHQITNRTAIHADKDRIRQLLLILLDNAIKFTPQNGTITLSVGTKPKPTICITDTGIGIDKKDREKIFDRFYQTEASHTGSGSGLGLAIAKSITDMHKATIKVQSEKGKGSAFTVTFNS